MTKVPIPDKEPPIDKAAERLKQFEDARKPQKQEDESGGNQEGESNNASEK